MNFRVNKEQLLNEIRTNVGVHVGNQLYQLTGGSEITMYQLRDIVKEAIVSGIEEAFETMLDSRYTDDDFENDMRLK